MASIHLLLYYLWKCFSGESVPAGRFELQLHKLIVKEILLRVLLPPIYQLLIERAHPILFEEVLP